MQHLSLLTAKSWQKVSPPLSPMLGVGSGVDSTVRSHTERISTQCQETTPDQQELFGKF